MHQSFIMEHLPERRDLTRQYTVVYSLLCGFLVPNLKKKKKIIVEAPGSSAQAQ